MRVGACAGGGWSVACFVRGFFCVDFERVHLYFEEEEEEEEEERAGQ